MSDVSAQLSEYPKGEDASAASKKYGFISNSQARKRDRKGRPQVPAPATSQAVKRESASSKPAPAAKVKEESSTAKTEATEAKPTKKEASAPSSKEATPTPSGSKKPAAKKGMAGSIMQSFAKAAARPPKPKPAPKEEDTSMALSDDGEADDSDIVASKSKPAVDAEEVRRKRQEREDALRKMMEDDDEDDNKEDSDKEEEQEDEEMEEAPEPEPEPEEPKEKKPSEVISSSGDGRRRGKRRVMKKKRILDDQGYMGKLSPSDRITGLNTNIFSSHDSRGRLGIILRGGSSEAGKEACANSNPVIIRIQGKEACSKGTRKHHVFLLQEIGGEESGARHEIDNMTDNILHIFIGFHSIAFSVQPLVLGWISLYPLQHCRQPFDAFNQVFFRHVGKR